MTGPDAAEPEPLAQPPPVAGLRVLVWGAGRHGGGIAAARHCERHHASVAILDRRSPRELPEAMAVAAAHGWPWHVGELAHPAWRSADLVVASPAIPPRALARLGRDGPPVVGADAFFFQRHRGPRVLVTGTKGKSTTASILATLLDWPVGGNSHQPLLDLLERHGPETPMVCELSSFQLWYLRRMRPEFEAVALTGLGADHLDWHGSEEAYRACKIAALGWAPTHVLAPDTTIDAPAGSQRLDPVRVVDGRFVLPDGRELARRAVLPLPGEHNARNAALALTVALHLGCDPGIAGIRLSRATPLQHRLQTVYESGSVRFVDDSMATTPEATLAAVAAVEGSLALILGGADKGARFDELAAAIARRGAQAVCTGLTGPRIHRALAEHGVDAPVVDDLGAAINLAVSRLAPGGGTVLLSPACAATDQHADFAERGRRFADLARAGWPAPAREEAFAAG